MDTGRHLLVLLALFVLCECGGHQYRSRRKGGGAKDKAPIVHHHQDNEFSIKGKSKSSAVRGRAMGLLGFLRVWRKSRTMEGTEGFTTQFGPIGLDRIMFWFGSKSVW
ncbi:hypothetical protein Zmor_005270 [Zophobas morio]|uniref:Uncharacterized protein n=1 Tax=Zophobas morio TaxID=2755281 RepID=A0AA38IXI1_9CUCU|nr:hypothetical protein Zmor_005270 [Zophobas morio]